MNPSQTLFRGVGGVFIGPGVYIYHVCEFSSVPFWKWFGPGLGENGRDAFVCLLSLLLFFFTFSFCTFFPFVALWIILHGFACISSPVASDGNYFAVLSKTEKEIIVPIRSTVSS